MITIQDRFIGMKKVEERLSYVNDDKTTCICASDIAQFLDEWYPEFFESIASNEDAYFRFNYSIQDMHYHSFAEISADVLADSDCLTTFDMEKTLANNYGYDSIEEMQRDYIIIVDVAIDGFLVIG